MNQIDSPLRMLFRSFGAASAQMASDALIEGMILGYNPRKVAPMVRDALGIQLNRALTICRTEVLRAHREAAHQIYAENADVVKGWRWQAALSGNTCAVCISLHGREFPMSEKMSSHP
ncbi:MAG TPA: phage minor head protein, partial [Anaerolineaceae bacterium]|nr:phage minor head protein [Anaerolineaceae bacterium]